MNQINPWFLTSKRLHLTLTLLPCATIMVAVAGNVLPVKADTTRACSEYRLVRDRSDNEVPLLPGASIAHCARFYQTEHQYNTEDLPSENSRAGHSDTDNPMQMDSTVHTPASTETGPEPSTPNQ